MRLNISKTTLKMTDKDFALEKKFQPRVQNPEHYTPVFITPEMQEEARKKGESWIEDITTHSKLMNRGDSDGNR